MSIQDLAIEPNQVHGDTLQLKFVPLSALSKLDEVLLRKNHKKHDMGALWQSIERYGFFSPAKWDNNLNDGNGGLVFGNGRTEAVVSMLLEAKTKGEEPPRGIATGDDGEWCVPVLFGVDQANEAMARSLAIDDNNLVMSGDFDAWDMAKMWDLPNYVANLAEIADYGIAPISVDEDAIASLLTGLSGYGEVAGSAPQEEDEDVDAVLDAADADDYVVRVKLGEIWQLGRHYIACGDCTVESNVEKLFDGRSAQLIHADPPYGMGKEKDGVINDNLYDSKLDAFQMLWWNEGRKYLDENGSVYIWGNSEDLWRLWYLGGLKDSERLTFRNQVVWDKKNGQGIMSEAHRMYPTVTEHCLFFMRGEQGFNNNADMFFDGWAGILEWLQEQREIMKWTSSVIHNILGVGDKGGGLASHYFGKSQWMLPTEPHYKKLQQAAQGKAFKREYDDIKREYDDIKREWYKTRAYFENTHDNMTDVWNYPRVKGDERWGHATPKPIEMMQRIYKSSCPVDGLIYSPFLGSGSDLIAAEQLGDRTVIGFELSPHYCSIILDRFSKLAGAEPICVGTLDD